MHSCDWAGEPVDCLRGANPRYVDKHPVENADLSQRGHNSGNHLDSEQYPGWDFHVVAKLEISSKLDALGRGDVTVGYKNHVGYRTAGKECAGDELADQINTAVLVGDSHDDPNGDEEDAANAQGKEEAVPGKVDRVAAIG